MPTTEQTDLRQHVKTVYGAAATEKAGLCCPKAMPSELTKHIPSDAFDHNYGCGTPVLKAGLKPGQVVVDLGSGVGIDCFVAAKIVGPEGQVIGVDMTDDMLARSFMFNNGVTKNLGYDVVEFRKGQMERLPLADNSVDVVMSNCVINLSPDKDQVFKEIFRVLKVGGRLVISDIVSDREVAPADQEDEEEWAACVTGSMSLGGAARRCQAGRLYRSAPARRIGLAEAERLQLQHADSRGDQVRIRLQRDPEQPRHLSRR